MAKKRKKQTADCDKCGLHATCTNFCIEGHGADRPDILFIGEAPGRSEDKEGRPFVGEAGKVLHKKIKELKLDEYALRFTNVVRCWPNIDGENRSPRKKEVECCLPLLVEEIKQTKPKLVVLLGKVAFNAIMRKGRITDWAGTLMRNEELSVDAIPVLHPAATLHRSANKRPFGTHMQAVSIYVKKGKKNKRARWNIILLDEDEAIKQLINWSIKQGELTAFDYETTSLDPDRGFPICVSLCSKLKTAHLIWFGLKGPTKKRRDLFARWLRSRSVPKIAQNAKFECRWSVYHFGAEPRALVGDTQQLHHLLEEESGHALDYLAYRYTPYGGYDLWMKTWKSEGNAIHEAPKEKIIEYGGGDAIVTRAVNKKLERKVCKDKRLTHLYNNIVIPAIRTLARMENRGMYVDLDRLDEIEDELGRKLRKEKEKIANYNVVDKTLRRWNEKRKKKIVELNLNSSHQVRMLMYDVLCLPVLRYTDNGVPSTKKEVLEVLEEEHPVLARISKVRSYDHELNVASQIRVRVREDGTVTSNYRYDYVVTGRLSSTDPNLQNQKRGGFVRKAIVSRWDGGLIMTSDYVQLELMLAANESKELEMIAVFERGGDIHSKTAELVFGVGFTEEQRYQAKRVNFGVLYGIGARELAWQLKKPKKIKFAKKLLRDHRRIYPYVDGYIEETRSFASRYGYVRSRLGRVRHLPDAESRDHKARSRALLQAGNFPIQAFAADITAWAMTRVDQRLEQEGMNSLVVGQIHDSVVLDIAPGEKERAEKLVKESMVDDLISTFDVFHVPIRVDVEIGKTW